MLVIGWLLVIISGCVERNVIVHIGDCEHGIVSDKNVSETQKIFPEARNTDVLISGGCYQEKFVRKE